MCSEGNEGHRRVMEGWQRREIGSLSKDGMTEREERAKKAKQYMMFYGMQEGCWRNDDA